MSARRRRIVYSDDAKAELSDIFLFTEEQWGKAQRRIYKQLILSTIRRLSQSPLLGRPRDDVSVGLRSFPVGNHVLYYWEHHGLLQIAHVLHSRRDATRYVWVTPATEGIQQEDDSPKSHLADGR